MDPFTILFALTVANIILEKGVLPARRLRREQVQQYDLGDIGKVGLKPIEIEELLRNPIIQRGLETEKHARRNSGGTHV